MNGKTKSGLTPADLDELAELKKALLKFAGVIIAQQTSRASVQDVLTGVNMLLAEDVE